MKIQDGDNYLELAVNLEADETLPSYGDAYILLKVSSNGYCGKNDLWVHYSDLKKFCKDIIDLEKYRKGEAVLSSMSPGELELRVFSSNSRGHMAVSGTTGYTVMGNEASFKHSVTFGFAFEPSQLVTLCQQEWIYKNA